MAVMNAHRTSLSPELVSPSSILPVLYRTLAPAFVVESIHTVSMPHSCAPHSVHATFMCSTCHRSCQLQHLLYRAIHPCVVRTLLRLGADPNRPVCSLSAAHVSPTLALALYTASPHQPSASRPPLNSLYTLPPSPRRLCSWQAPHVDAALHPTALFLAPDSAVAAIFLANGAYAHTRNVTSSNDR